MKSNQTLTSGIHLEMIEASKDVQCSGTTTPFVKQGGALFEQQIYAHKSQWKTQVGPHFPTINPAAKQGELRRRLSPSGVVVICAKRVRKNSELSVKSNVFNAI